jgi:hypothetical protein
VAGRIRPIEKKNPPIEILGIYDKFVLSDDDNDGDGDVEDDDYLYCKNIFSSTPWHEISVMK